MEHCFPFGRPSSPRPPRAPTGAASAFVLGVYPSALHVRSSLDGREQVKALVVDVEPTVFWTGEDAEELVQEWRSLVGWREEWGSATPAAQNGYSGRIVREEVLKPLGLSFEETWLTDVVNTFFVKNGPDSQSEAIERRYTPFARQHGLSACTLPVRPSPSALIDLAISEQAARLRSELMQARPEIVITLGNEALAVLHRIARCPDLPSRLAPDSTYGRKGTMAMDGLTAAVLPLVHPGQRGEAWMAAHQRWKEGATSCAKLT